MKKILVVFILCCVLSVSAFAQLVVGAYTQSFWIPYRLTVPENGETQHTTAVQTPWGGPDISAGINFDGHSDWGGIHLGVDVANGASNQSANPFSAKGSGWVWAKPFNFFPVTESFTIFLGNPSSEQLMGKIGGSNLATYVLNSSYRLHNHRLEIQNPQYNIFSRFNPYSWGNADNGTQNLYWPRIAAAVMITWEPIENLFIGAFIAPEQFNLVGWGDIGGASWANTEPANGDPLADDDINQDYYNVNEVYRKIQFGVGYNMPGIGFARAQYVGIRNTIELAFQVTALGDLVLDIGAKIPFEGTLREDTDTYKRRKDFQASIAATFRYYDFRLLARVDTAFAGSNSAPPLQEVIVNGLNLIAYIVPSYQLSIGTVGLDLGFEYEQADKVNNYTDDSMQAGAALWLQRNIGSATFKVAVVTRFPLTWYQNMSASPPNSLPTYWNGSATTPFELLIPIYLMVGF